MRDNFLWTEKYRPKKIDDVVLPDRIKAQFKSFVEKKDIPTLLLVGGPGVGKTTIAIAMLEEIGADYILINGSLEGRLIDTLRTKIEDFASTTSMLSDSRKYVIIDEADYLNPESVQPALRGFIEKFAGNCGFIFTCNYEAKIREAIHSRCSRVYFKLTEEEKNACCVQFLKRTCQILEKEGLLPDDDVKIKETKKILAQVINKYYPDWRKILNELQKYSHSGVIDIGILQDLKAINLDQVVAFCKKKDFTSVRKWVAENADQDPIHLFTEFYNHADRYLSKKHIPVFVLLLAQYMNWSAFAANQEINTASFFADVMSQCEFE